MHITVVWCEATIIPETKEEQLQNRWVKKLMGY